MSDEATTISFFTGTSMLPLLHLGDHVELVPVQQDEVHPGDIIVFPGRDGKQIIHRIVRLSPLQTRGDNCAHDDPPIAPDATIHLAVAFLRNGRRHLLSSGDAGLREFRRHQRRRRLLEVLHRLLAPLCALNPFKVPFQKLTHVSFGDRRVYYAGRRPVGWYDQDGWHWMRFGRFIAQRPPDK